MTRTVITTDGKQDVKAYNVTIPGYEEFTFFTHHDVQNGETLKTWALSEATTGRFVRHGRRTRKEAIEDSMRLFDELGRAEVSRVINSFPKLAEV